MLTAGRLELARVPRGPQRFRKEIGGESDFGVSLLSLYDVGRCLLGFSRLLAPSHILSWLAAISSAGSVGLSLLRMPNTVLSTVH